MDIEIRTKNLEAALKTAYKLSINNTSLPILNNSLLVVEGGLLTITTTNLEIAIISEVNGKVSAEGAVTVPTRLLYDLVNNLNNETIKLTSSDNKLNINTSNFNSFISGLSPTDFPTIPQFIQGLDFEVDSVKAKDLATDLSNALNTASKEDTRPILNGVLFTNDNQQLNLASTDSYRLSEISTNIELKKELNVVVPNQAVSAITSMLSEAVSASFVLVDNQIQVTTDNSKLISKTIDGKFPDYKNLIPKDSEVEVEFDGAELMSAVKSASLFSKISGGSIVLSVESDVFKVESTTSQLGQNSSVVSAKASGQGQVVINSRFIVDALNSFKDSNLSMGFSSNLKPVVIKSSDSSNNLQLIMPLKS